MPNLDEFFEQVDGMPDSYLECRGSQHIPEITSRLRVVDSRREAGERPHKGHEVFAKREITCPRCGMQRWDYFEITSRGGHTALVKIGSSTYRPPEGYSTSGLGRIKGSRDLILGLQLERSTQRAQ